MTKEKQNSLWVVMLKNGNTKTVWCPFKNEEKQKCKIRLHVTCDRQNKNATTVNELLPDDCPLHMEDILVTAEHYGKHCVIENEYINQKEGNHEN